MKTKIETILFISPAPLTVKKIADKLEIGKEEAEIIIKKLQKEYNDDKRGFRIVFDGNAAEMASAPENSGIAADFFGGEREEELSRPSLEALAIIASKGAASKEEIEEIRGINSSITIRNLMIKGLIEESGKPGAGGYKVSLDFLKKFAMENAESLADFLNN